MKFIIRVAFTVIFLVLTGLQIRAQESKGNLTKAQRKAEKLQAKQKDRDKKAKVKGEKRHLQLQDKKTRKRMKKHRKKVDKHYPGKPSSYFYIKPELPDHLIANL
ncbi:MAG: hypothetical protein LC117_03210 [Bacteroidia bacterium]|nr:hypothetical protein [Bacteroidia bacterium]MCZ2276920.1 hypothetical protein [Bacteroidia bacterium]